MNQWVVDVGIAECFRQILGLIALGGGGFHRKCAAVGSGIQWKRLLGIILRPVRVINIFTRHNSFNRSLQSCSTYQSIAKVVASVVVKTKGFDQQFPFTDDALPIAQRHRSFSVRSLPSRHSRRTLKWTRFVHVEDRTWWNSCTRFVLSLLYIAFSS